jgi:hypothetical protein
MHRLKTGALLQGSVEMGAACGHVSTAALKALCEYGAAIGLAFQVVDDILDVTADSQTLGKTAGKDAAADKPTYVSLLGLDGARTQARQLLADALAALAGAAWPTPPRCARWPTWWSTATAEKRTNPTWLRCFPLSTTPRRSASTTAHSCGNCPTRCAPACSTTSRAPAAT